jgi:hypothetical protein
MSRGRQVPPPAFKAELPKLTPDQVAEMLVTSPGLYVLHVLHDDHCPAIKSQRDDDCVCSPDHILQRVEAAND